MVRSQRGEWRLSSPLYKLAISAHIIVSVGGLGVVIAKLALAVAAARAGQPGAAPGLYAAITVIDWVFPPVVILTALTGVVLGLGTTWGLIQYTWVVVKIVLTVAVPVSAVRIGHRLLEQSMADPPPLTVADSVLSSVLAPPGLLAALAVAHVLMLGAAAIISVYKPWGRTWFGRRTAARAALRPALSVTSGE